MAQMRVAGLALAAVLALPGCAAADHTTAHGSGLPDGVPVYYECVLQSDGGEVELGETVAVSRGPDGPCQGLAIGATQTFELRSDHVDDTARATVEVDVAEDGSFAFVVRVPRDLRLGQAALQPIPAGPGCEDPDVLDCPPPSVRLTVTHPPAALEPVHVASVGIEAPALPGAPLGERGYYRVGPAAGQVTLTIIGSGCETYPASYVTTAPPDSLELVTETAGGACTDAALPWTSVITVPEGYEGFSSVKIDNVPAQLRPAP